MIGIVGGVGPLAGLDIFKKIIEETIATKDQEHLPVILSSQPHHIADRTAFLLKKSNENPGYALSKIIHELEDAGAEVAAIPCNTAHAPAIFDVITKQIENSNIKIKLLHIVEETAKFIKANYPDQMVGVLSTTGTRDTRLYTDILSNFGIANIAPDDELQPLVHEAIYNEQYGIKACSSPVTAKATENLNQAISVLQKQGAQVIVLACTELPLALTEKSYFGIPTVDPNRILARALIEYIAPEKLKSLE
ncbi:MAG: aspartate/glutamate racemase family protein [Sphingobacterium composti]|uniref:aspartate/glutamate racemase family protein n=1 Tax=Sphingobacterium composti TaxID=363260 RepID=UPI00135B48C3|nr:amino acid racemase [Sphingobacterium composti Ten et al. 2007 non Yoo et al. 2007]